MMTPEELKRIKLDHGKGHTMGFGGCDMCSILFDLDQATRERDFAIAHDTQPYPTADAYEKSCAAREKLRDQRDHWRERHKKLRDTLRGIQGNGGCGDCSDNCFYAKEALAADDLAS